LENLDFAVARTARELSDQLYRLELDPALQRSPLFIADIQTTHGRDPASLRWYERSATALSIRITEEQSLDAETDHTTEVLGYILFAD
jgi:hypothetical protein